MTVLGRSSHEDPPDSYEIYQKIQHESVVMNVSGASCGNEG